MYNLVEFMAARIKLLKIREVAEMLGVNPETLRRWNHKGKLKAVRIGSRSIQRIKEQLEIGVIKKRKSNKWLKNDKLHLGRIKDEISSCF